LDLMVPVIVLVLGATAIPVELRRFDFSNVSLGLNARDLVLNVLIYIPVGLVLSRLGFCRAAVIAMLLSLFAATCQFFMMHRYPSPFDLAMNVAGAAIGLLISGRFRVRVPAIHLSLRIAWLSVIAALGILGFKARSEWEEKSVNCRGATSPGSLEAHWTFD